MIIFFKEKAREANNNNIREAKKEDKMWSILLSDATCGKSCHRQRKTIWITLYATFETNTQLSEYLRLTEAKVNTSDAKNNNKK
jgi:hypothetical protein